MDVGYYALQPEPRKSSCPPYSLIASNQETKAPSNKKTTTGCSCSGTGGSVVKPLRHLAHHEGAHFAVLGFSGFISMVDIHSMAASSHPSHHEREVERGATSRPRVGRPRHTGGRSGATTVIVESLPQRTAGAMPAPSVVAGANATLLTARQLLNNPPSMHHFDIWRAR
jgi:hypothetical protein